MGGTSAARDDEVAALRARLPAHSLAPVLLIVAVGAVDAGSRSALAAVLDDVKAEFGVGDTAMGVLGGAFFGLATLSYIPCGVLADRWRRSALIAIGFVPWSLGMLLQGVAGSFAALFGARLLLGSVEATNAPAAQSLLGDQYAVERRGRVMGTYRLGDVLGGSVAFAVAGALGTAFGWRSTFFVFGALGLVCGAAVWRFLPEPPRGVADALHAAEHEAEHGCPAPAPVPVPVDTGSPTSISWRAAVRRIVRIRTAWVMVFAAGIGDFFFTGLASWAATFFRRYHGLSAAESSSMMSVVLLTVVAGVFVGGRRADRLVRDGRPADRAVLGAVGFGVGCAFALAAFSVGSLPAAVVLLGFAGFFVYLPIPGLWAMWIDIIPAELRGRAASLGSIVRAAFVAGGPALVGFLSDAWTLRAAFLLVAPSLAVNGFLLLAGRRTFDADAAAARRRS